MWALPLPIFLLLLWIFRRFFATRGHTLSTSHYFLRATSHASGCRVRRYVLSAIPRLLLSVLVLFALAMAGALPSWQNETWDTFGGRFLSRARSLTLLDKSDQPCAGDVPLLERSRITVTEACVEHLCKVGEKGNGPLLPITDSITLFDRLDWGTCAYLLAMTVVMFLTTILLFDYLCRWQRLVLALSGYVAMGVGFAMSFHVLVADSLAGHNDPVFASLAKNDVPLAPFAFRAAVAGVAAARAMHDGDAKATACECEVNEKVDMPLTTSRSFLASLARKERMSSVFVQDAPTEAFKAAPLIDGGTFVLATLVFKRGEFDTRESPVYDHDHDHVLRDLTGVAEIDLQWYGGADYHKFRTSNNEDLAKRRIQKTERCAHERTLLSWEFDHNGPVAEGLRQAS